MMNKNRQAMKQTNYALLREAGFTAEEANYFKGRSHQNVVEMSRIKAMYDVIKPKCNEDMRHDLWKLAEKLSSTWKPQQVHEHIIEYLEKYFVLTLYSLYDGDGYE